MAKLVEYSEDTQKLFIEYLISDRTLFTRCQNILKPEYWDTKLRKTAKFVLEYAEKYNSLPTPEQIKATTKISLNKIDSPENQADWFLSGVESFCRHKAMEQLILDGPALLEAGDYAAIEKRSKENILISLQKDLGTEYFVNPLSRLQEMKTKTAMTSTGWAEIDKALYGGMNNGEVSVWIGLPGAGKSLFLQNIALNWVEKGKNVVYISLELSESLVSLRFDAMLTGKSTKEIWANMDETAIKIGMIYKSSKKLGKLNVKKMSEAGTTVNDIRAYLREYELQTGTKVDAICVDYLDLLYPNSDKVDINSTFTKDKFVTEELRGLANELNILCNTASQINRSGVQEQVFDYSHIAGGISKINTADNVMGIFTSQHMKENGEYQIQFMKTRSSNGVGKKVNLSYNKETLRITDAETPFSEKSSGMEGVHKALAKNKTEKGKESETDIIARMKNIAKHKSSI